MRHMSMQADLLIDRRRLKRRLSFWRAGAVLLAVGLILALVGVGTGRGAHVARLEVRGFVSDDRKLMEALDKLRRDDSVRAVLVDIDSPGGSVGGGEALFAALSAIREHKPVVAVMGGTAASAAYMAALPADRIFAREMSITGSIGVLLQSVELSQLFDRLGVRSESLVSGPMKDQPSLFHPLSEEGRAVLQGVISDLYDQFVRKVATARHMPEDKVRPLADGRVFSGRQALTLGLIDAIGGEREARVWLATEKGVAENLPVQPVETRSRVERMLQSSAATLAKTLVSEWLGVDGFRLLWQP
jgi:protease IV